MVPGGQSEADRQLPLAGEIFLDHVGHFVRDPDAASRALARVGFAPTPASVQINPDPAGGAPRLTGTGNVTAMLSRGYIEVLFKTADTPLGHELDAAMARYPGVHLAAFVVDNAADAHRRLADEGFRVQPLVDMRRPVDTGAGTGTGAFTVARLEPGEMPEGRIQILTHRTERMVWQPRWLSHPNGALGCEARPRRDGRTLELDRGQVELVTADAFVQMLPEIPIPSLPFVGAYAIRVKSLATLGDILTRAGLKTWRHERALAATFPEELGHGAWLFVE